MKIVSGWRLECIGCGTNLDSDPTTFVCPKCGDLLQLVMEEGRHLSKSELFGRTGEGIWRFRAALPLGPEVPPVSLREGSTPLLKAKNVGRDVSLANLYVKNEGQNPTASFKDRGMTVSVTRAVQAKARVLICASTGNTSASMAAYAARAGVGAAIVVPSGKVAAGKLVQAVAYGAEIIRAEGTFDDALSLVLEAGSDAPGYAVMNSVNPYRIEGQKTAAFEIFEQLGFVVPDYVVLPVGNAGNISAIWKGFRELKSLGITEDLPRMVGVQAEGAAPVARAFWRGSDSIVPIDDPHTVASAIRIGNPASGKKALSALRESEGMALTVTDDQIVEARRTLASKEGIFVEPASAAPIAGLFEVGRRFERDALVVCVGTGSGLKDQESVEMALERMPIVSDGSALMKLLEKLAVASVQ